MNDELSTGRQDPALEDLCSLSAEQRSERVASIRLEILPHAEKREPLGRGYAWEFPARPGLRERLEQLVELERQCCSGPRWGLSESGSGTLRLTVEGVDPESKVFDAFAVRGLS